jgi:signal transduction histidine kinase
LFRGLAKKAPVQYTRAAGDAAESPEPVELDLAEVIRAAVELVAPAARARPRGRAGGPGTTPAHGDPDQLAQILGNLLQNALRYTAPGGRIGIAAEQRPADILVSVTTTGEGIPAVDLPHVLERFYRVDKSRDRAHVGPASAYPS